MLKYHWDLLHIVALEPLFPLVHSLCSVIRCPACAWPLNYAPECVRCIPEADLHYVWPEKFKGWVKDAWTCKLASYSEKVKAITLLCKWQGQITCAHFRSAERGSKLLTRWATWITVMVWISIIFFFLCSVRKTAVREESTASMDSTVLRRVQVAGPVRRAAHVIDRS